MLTYVIGGLLILMAIFLVISVLMQSSKDHRLGGSIAGGAETFFGKTKGKSMDAMFNKLTTIVAIVFVVLVVVLYVVQPEPCMFCGSTEHEAETIEDCETYKQVQEEAASGANLEEEAAASDANLEADVEEPAADEAPEADAEEPVADEAPEAGAEEPVADEAPEADAEVAAE